MQPIIERHQRIVLQFSGGKDSLAVLELCKPYWDRIMVLWLNTGAALPETLQQMREIEAKVPHFLEWPSDQPRQILFHGYPSDIVPMTHTEMGRLIDDHTKPLLQPYYQCCAANIWEPLQQATQLCGATLVIRGQRNAEAKKSPVRSGDVIDGVEYLFPIEDWSGEQVRDYLIQQSVELPEHYRQFDSSLDCWNCSAYLQENVGKLDYLRTHHADKARELERRIRFIGDAVQQEQMHIEQFLGEGHD